MARCTTLRSVRLSLERPRCDEVSRRLWRQSPRGVFAKPQIAGDANACRISRAVRALQSDRRIGRQMGFTAGLHNHMGQMVQNQDEVDRFMAMTDPKLFGLSPDTCHLNLAGCDVVGTLSATSIASGFWITRTRNGRRRPRIGCSRTERCFPRTRADARFFNSSYDLGDGQVDFPACHRVLKSVNYRGWICVDLDTSRLGPLADFQRCGAYIVNKLEPIYL